MHRAVLVASLALVACSPPREHRAPLHKAAPEASAAVHATAGAPFAGVWEACDGAVSPDQCSRYTLVQHGNRICGTWSYVATGDGYEGRVVAEALSASEARRVRICGRPGSEARTACTDGWDRIDKPLRLCDGKLADIDSSGGACRADYIRAAATAEAAELAREPWVRACLAEGGEEAAR